MSESTPAGPVGPAPAAPATPAPMFASLGPEVLANPYPFYDMLRQAGPVVAAPGLMGIGGWAVTDHALCSSVLRGKQFGREGNKVLPPEKLALIPQESPDLTERRRANMLFRDPPDHTRLRGLVNQAFTPRTVDRLRPHIQQIADHLLDAVATRGSMDLIRDYAFPLPIIVIAELLGVPPEDRDEFKAWSSDLVLSLSPMPSPEDMQKVRAAIENIDNYMAGIIEQRRREPRPDLLSELVRAQEAGDRLSREELLATCRLILTAGHETTINLIGNGALALLRNDAERAELARDPSLLPTAVEEFLRYDSPIQMTVRFTLEDTPLGPHTVKRGDLVLTLLGAANRDPAQFPDPHRLDLRRSNASTHLSLGAGIHYCLGASLARVEGQIAIGTLLRRMPNLALTGAEIAWRKNPAFRGVQSLPVTF